MTRRAGVLVTLSACSPPPLGGSSSLATATTLTLTVPARREPAARATNRSAPRAVLAATGTSSSPLREAQNALRSSFVFAAASE